MPGEPPDVSTIIPASAIPAEILKSSLGGSASINLGFDRQAMRKVEGDPQAGPIDDARREAYLAYTLARRPDVEKVLLGDAAVHFLYGRAKTEGQQDVDVIALLNSSEVIIGDAKGEYFAKAIVEQMPHTSMVLRNKGKIVTEGVVLALQPKTVIWSTALEDGGRRWIQAGARHQSIDPAVFANQKPPCDPSYAYLLDPGFHVLHNPSGFAVKPYTNFPLLETHIHAPHVDGFGHIQP